MIKYIGIDGCRGGWIAVYIENGEVSVRVESAKRKENSKEAKGLEAFGFTKDDVILIDMPILSAEGKRNNLDQVLRNEMQKNGNKGSVFSIPDDLLKDVGGRLLINEDVLKTTSEQLKGIAEKIEETCNFAKKSIEFKFWESHPEFCFELLKKEKAPLLKKKSGGGIAERLLILQEYLGIRGINTLLKKAKDLKEKDFDFDDLLDAACLAVMAKEIGFNALEKIVPIENSKSKEKKISEKIEYPFIAYAINPAKKD